MWRQPDSRFQAKTLDVRSQAVHAARETIVDGGPVAVLTEAVACALPAIVDLDILNTVVFEVLSDPFGCDLDLAFVDLLVEEVPGTPARGRQRKPRLVDRREVFNLECVAKLVFENGAVFQTQFIFGWIKSPVGDGR
jgi:hypothetical protein